MITIIKIKPKLNKKTNLVFGTKISLSKLKNKYAETIYFHWKIQSIFSFIKQLPLKTFFLQIYVLELVAPRASQIFLLVFCIFFHSSIQLLMIIKLKWINTSN